MPILVKVLLFIVVVGINSLNANASVNNISPTQDINGTAQNDSATAPKSTYTTESKPADSIEFEPSDTTEIEPTDTIEPEPDEATEPTNTTEPKATPAPQETYDEFELETGNLYLSPETLEWIDVQHNTWSQDVSYIGAYLDNFMGNSEIFQDNNKSFLKIYFDLDTSKYDGVSFKPRVKARLDLPVTKKKFRIVIENDPDQERGIAERNLSDLPSTERQENDGLYGSLLYLFESKKWSRLSFDWGVKARWPPDPFARFRAVRGWELNEYWNMAYSQEVFIFESKGFGTYSQWDFDRWLSRAYLFRATTVLDWHERTEQFDLLQQFSLFQDIDKKRAIQYAAGVVAEEKKGSRVTNYYAKATYRRRLYKDWLFYELTPGIEFQREYSFNPNPFIGVRLEMLFSTDADRKLTTRLY